MRLPLLVALTGTKLLTGPVAEAAIERPDIYTDLFCDLCRRKRCISPQSLGSLFLTESQKRIWGRSHVLVAPL